MITCVFYYDLVDDVLIALIVSMAMDLEQNE